jgi:hypothetical protein
VKGSQRNLACPCGSGKKYKKCCLDRERERELGERPALTIDGSTSTKVEDAHIVPRMFQRAWEVPGRKVAVHVNGGERCEEKSTKVVGTRGPFYRRVRPTGDQIDDVEKSLSVIEDKAATPLRALINGQPLTAERKGILAQLFGVQMVRGPAFFDQREEIVRPMLEGVGAEAFKPAGLAAVGVDVSLAREKAIEAYLNATQRFVTMLSYAVKIASVLGLMRWQVLRFKDPVLAYSDHPVVLWPLKLDSSAPFDRQQLGALETREILIPVSPQAAVLMNWIDLSDEISMDIAPSIAPQINAFVISQSQSDWMHKVGFEPGIGEGAFEPPSRVIDPAYGQETVLSSARHAKAAEIVRQFSGRKFVNYVQVVVEIPGTTAEPHS